MSGRALAAIAAGGAAGALARAGAIEWIGSVGVALLLANVIGSFLLGIAVVRLAGEPTALAGVGTGFCGALTSMSTFAVDVAGRFHAGDVFGGLALASITVVAVVAGAWAGVHMVRGTP